MAGKGKRYRKASEGVSRDTVYNVQDAVKLIKERATAKFDETIEVAMNLGVDPRHADQNVRGVVSLPNGTGRNVRVAVFAKGAKAEEAQKAGADIVGEADLAGELSWFSGAIQAEVRRPRWVLVVQLFNHGTHHRGQVNAMLTAAGARLDDTDVPFMQSEHYPWP